MNHQEQLTSYISSFISEMVNSNVTDVVVSPGSRSTPIAMLMAEHPELKLHIQVDERSAGFFALGIAKASKQPVALLCTSGTAAANYFPAIAEANISRIPLVVVTADRPHELRDVGAPQTIDQIHLYGNHVKWFVEMALPEQSEDLIRYARTIGGRAAVTALQAPAGPVHVNFPLREPLIPKIENDNLFLKTKRLSGSVTVHQMIPVLHEDEYIELAKLLESSQNGIIICGQIDDTDFANCITSFANKIKFPILADPLSQLRSGSHQGTMIIDAYDTFLRNDDVKSHLKPDLIIRFGSMPVSKALLVFLKENREAKQIIVDGGVGWRDPALLATDIVHCQETTFCCEIEKRISAKQVTEYCQKWKNTNNYTKKLLPTINNTEDLSEGKLFYQLSEWLPENATLFVGNSMPIRDLDSFYLYNQKNMTIMANRGANGIDGTLSTALGASTIKQPFYLIVGDLTFFHDLNGLIAAKLQQLDITILLINNNGGGIFSFLPQASHPKHFELLFGTPLDLDFSKAVDMYGGTFISVSNWEELKTTILKDQELKGLRVIEINTERNKNVKQHRDLWNFVSQEISCFVKGES